MVGEAFIKEKDNIVLRIEGYFVSAVEQEFFVFGDLLDAWGYFVDIEGGWVFAAEAKENCYICAVAFACFCE